MAEASEGAPVEDLGSSALPLLLLSLLPLLLRLSLMLLLPLPLLSLVPPSALLLFDAGLGKGRNGEAAAFRRG